MDDNLTIGFDFKNGVFITVKMLKDMDYRLNGMFEDKFESWYFYCFKPFRYSPDNGVEIDWEQLPKPLSFKFPWRLHR